MMLCICLFLLIMIKGVVVYGTCSAGMVCIHFLTSQVGMVIVSSSAYESPMLSNNCWLTSLLE